MSTNEQNSILDENSLPDANTPEVETEKTPIDPTEPILISTELVTTNSESTPPKNELLQGKKPRLKKKEQPPTKDASKARYTWSLSLSPAENDYVETIYQARLKANLAKDRNHFLKTTLDFALNSRSIEGLVFAVPEGLPVQHLENGFFNKK